MSVINLTDLSNKRGAFGFLKPKMCLGIPEESFAYSYVSIGVDPNFRLWVFVL